MPEKTLEEITGKKREEIAFYEDTNGVLEEIEGLSITLPKQQARVLFEVAAAHYKSLAQIDGIREDMKAVSEYFFKRAKEN